MNQANGIIIVISLVLFFLIDVTLFVNSLRQKANSNSIKLFMHLAGIIMIMQGLTVFGYSCAYKLIIVNPFVTFFTDFLSLVSATMASYIWFIYFLLTNEGENKQHSLGFKLIFALPIFILFILGVTSQWTHWLFYIDNDGVFQKGPLIFVQYIACVYILFAFCSIKYFYKNGHIFSSIIYRICIFVCPPVIGMLLNQFTYKAGFTQIGYSYTLFLIYLEQYIVEVNENKRLKSIETLNSSLQFANKKLIEQMSVVSGLSNAYFAVHAVDLVNKTSRGVKEIEFFRNVIKGADSVDFVISSFLNYCVSEEDLKSMQDFVDLSTIQERLKGKVTIVQIFHGKISPWEWCRASWIVSGFDNDGKITNLLFTVEDITARQKEKIALEEERLQESKLEKLRLQTMSEAIRGGFKISKVDKNFTFIMVSEQFATLLGYDSPEEVMTTCGSMFNMVNREDARREIPLATEDVLSGKMYTMHYRIRCKNGEWKSVEDKGRLFNKPNGEQEYWSFITDQDELTQKEKALTAANQANEALEQAQIELKKAKTIAENASKAKTDFLFSMSHDIRTPMNAIIGYIDLIENHFSEQDKCLDYLNKIKNSSNFLLSLINNVLEMARIESGKLLLDEKTYKISDIVDEITSVFTELMKQKNIQFNLTLDITTTEYYYIDKVKISEIFLNIFSNAYKYTNAGGKVSAITTELPCSKDGYIILQTTISDTGIGMSKEFLPHIFDEFSRERTSTESKIEGTGLGLPIVKKLVDFLDGTIQVESEQGKGSKFIVTLPHKIATNSQISQTESVDFNQEKCKGKRVLLVEDNKLNAEIATEILGNFGLKIEHAEDGLVCIDMINTHNCDYYDIIFMDIQMPNLNGYEATKQIRALKDKVKANIPIVAMTANAFEEDRNNALSCGMNDHLAKPLEILEIKKALAKIFK